MTLLFPLSVSSVCLSLRLIAMRCLLMPSMVLTVWITHTIGNVLRLAYALADDGDDLRDFRGTCQFVHRMAC